MDFEYEAAQYVQSLKHTFGDTPTWGMVRVAYQYGAYQAAHKIEISGAKENN